MRKQYAFIRIFAILLTSAISAGDFFCTAAVNNTVGDTLPVLNVEASAKAKDIKGATPVYRLDADHLRQAGINGISEALRSLPGINLMDYGGAGGLKTVSVRGLGSKHTGVIYDGLPLSDLQNGDIDLSRFSLNNMSEMAILMVGENDIFLPARAVANASTLYLTSLCNTHKKGFSSTLRLKSGSFGLINPFADVKYDNGKNLSLAANADFLHADNNYPFTLRNGSEETREKRNNSSMNSLHTEINAIFKPTVKSRLAAKAYYYNNHRHLPGPVIYYANPSNQKMHDRNFLSQLDYRNQTSGRFTFRILAKYNWATTRYTDADGQYPGGLLDQYYIQKQIYTSASALYSPSSLLMLSYAADCERNDIKSNLPSNTDPYRNALLQTIGAKFTWNFVNLNARILHSYYIDRSRLANGKNNWSRFSPSFSLSLHPFQSQSLFIRAAFKEIMRMPTFSELYFDHYGTINLDPETTDQYNLGITYSIPTGSSTWLSNLYLTADGYINKIKNKIVAIPFNMFLWRMTNLGKVSALGADISLNTDITLSPIHTLSISGSYSYLRAQNRTSPERSDWKRQVAYTPLNSGSATLCWQNPWVNIGMNTIGASSRYATNENLPQTRIDGYCEFGFTLSHTFSLRRNDLTLRADLVNAFNTQYEIIRRYPMPGRRWELSAELKLNK